MYPQIIVPSRAAVRHRGAGADAPRGTAAAMFAQKGPNRIQTFCSSPSPKSAAPRHMRILFHPTTSANRPCGEKLVAGRARPLAYRS